MNKSYFCHDFFSSIQKYEQQAGNCGKLAAPLHGRTG